MRWWNKVEFFFTDRDEPRDRSEVLHIHYMPKTGSKILVVCVRQ